MFESTIISGQIYLGKQGEHCARRLSFNDVRIWSEIFGEGTCELIHQRNGDEAPYPVAMEIDNGVPYWCVSASDTAIAGEGKCEIRYIVNGTVVKSNIYSTFVQKSLGEGTAEPPEPQNTWVDVVVQAGAEAKQSAMSADVAKSASEEFAQEAETHSKNAQTSAKNAQESAENALRERGLSSIYAEDAKTYAEFASQKAEEAKGYANEISANTEFVAHKAEEASEDATIVKDAVNGMNTTFANALKGTVAGVNAVKLEGISPIQHNIEVKTDVPVGFKSYGKNMTPYDVSKWVTSGDNAYYYLDTPRFEFVITLWRDVVRGTFDLWIYNENGGYVDSQRFFATSGDKKSLRIPYQEGYTYRIKTTKNALELITKGTLNIWFQVEADKPTEYEEYKPPVDGVVWVHPTTTLVADAPGAIIEATYNRDINKAFAELQNALLSMGGNI